MAAEPMGGCLLWRGESSEGLRRAFGWAFGGAFSGAFGGNIGEAFRGGAEESAGGGGGAFCGRAGRCLIRSRRGFLPFGGAEGGASNFQERCQFILRALSDRASSRGRNYGGVLFTVGRTAGFTGAVWVLRSQINMLLLSVFDLRLRFRSTFRTVQLIAQKGIEKCTTR